MDIKSKYREIAMESFETIFNLFRFERDLDKIINHARAHKLQKQCETIEISSFEMKDFLAKYLDLQKKQQKKDKLTIKHEFISMKSWQEKNKASLLKISFVNRLFEAYLETKFKRIFPYKDFEKICKDAKACVYCHIDKAAVQDLIKKERLFKNDPTRGWELEIDRKFPNLEYSDENCVICCYWCNNAKTDEFNHYEFIPIGKEIQRVWEARLGRKLSN